MFSRHFSSENEKLFCIDINYFYAKCSFAGAKSGTGSSSDTDWIDPIIAQDFGKLIYDKNNISRVLFGCSAVVTIKFEQFDFTTASKFDNASEFTTITTSDSIHTYTAKTSVNFRNLSQITVPILVSKKSLGNGIDLSVNSVNNYLIPISTYLFLTIHLVNKSLGDGVTNVFPGDLDEGTRVIKTMTGLKLLNGFSIIKIMKITINTNSTSAPSTLLQCALQFTTKVTNISDCNVFEPVTNDIMFSNCMGIGYTTVVKF